MNFEKLAEKNRIENDTRNAGADNFLKFLEEGGYFEKVDESPIVEVLASGDYDRFMNALQNLNAAFRNQTSEESKPFSAQMQSASSLGTRVDFVYPEPVTGEKMMKEIFSQLAEAAKETDQESRQKLAITLFNAVNFLHPMTDANGRLARFLYLETSPYFDRASQENKREQTKRIFLKRDERIDNYFRLLKLAEYQNLLEKRGYSTAVDEKDQDYLHRMFSSDVLGFDGEYIRFIAAMDALSDEEKVKYNVCENPAGLMLDEGELPPEVKARIDQNMKDVRNEFVHDILEFSLSENSSPAWLIEGLNQSFFATEPSK